MWFTTARGALLALLAVVVMSIVGSASASAAEQCSKKAGSKFYVLCTRSEPKGQLYKVGSPTEAKEVEYALSLKEGTKVHFTLKYGAGNFNEVTCSAATFYEFHSIRSGGGKSAVLQKLEFELQSCTWSIPSCKVSEVSFGTTHSIEGAFGPAAEAVTLSVPPADTFGGFALTNCGLFNGFHLAQGSQECKLKEAEVPQATKALVCEPSGSKLENKQQQEKFTLSIETNLKLANPAEYKGKEFAIIED
jgi:hypothetical protein